jgi:hypothetical protein
MVNMGEPKESGVQIGRKLLAGLDEKLHDCLHSARLGQNTFDMLEVDQLPGQRGECSQELVKTLEPDLLSAGILSKVSKTFRSKLLRGSSNPPWLPPHEIPWQANQSTRKFLISELCT